MCGFEMSSWSARQASPVPSVQTETGRQRVLVSFPGDLEERQDGGKFAQLYKTGQNGKGDHGIV